MAQKNSLLIQKKEGFKSVLRDLQDEQTSLKNKLENISQSEIDLTHVVDDILIGFDDNRTRVCLEVLANLSARIQVLLFTHHKRVLELAESCNANSQIFHHQLT